MNTTRMNPEIKEQWVAALRSGDYAQGQGFLRQREDEGTETYCCLGVLCDLAVKAGLAIAVYEPTEDYHFATYGEQQVEAFPPSEVQEWAGLQVDDPEVRLRDNDPVPVALNADQTLAALNDSGLTFEDIARIIEEYL